MLSNAEVHYTVNVSCNWVVQAEQHTKLKAVKELCSAVLPGVYSFTNSKFKDKHMLYYVYIIYRNAPQLWVQRCK